ncbi:division/cell wall cluster transcriptional repressor MraZ [Candidatus Pandoraea novymonadis]|uniref:division/cell wall cluster transcriptional repressor MraZ n=1 Tax=Candidatus Pandoraea novymonadis TaxID=1808959 RepID=UPI000D051EE1|nr:division/cell wall cluster transcriptional repressor MraZ [Candidatus Pandoraea novymonadis]
MFQGASALSLDVKGRMSIPARHRDVLVSQTEGKVTITKHPEGCLLLFPRDQWEVFRNKIIALPMEAQWWRRIFLGNAADVEMDSGGRVLVPPELRASAGLDKELMLLGMASHFELWDAAMYALNEQAAMAKGMPETLKQFIF